MQVKLASQPITWWSPEANGFETAATEIAAVGFKGIEPPVADYLGRLGELKELLARLGLECSSTYTGAPFENEEKRAEATANIVRTAAVLPELGCDRIVLSSGGRPEGEVPYEMIERFADGATECARQCYEQYGVKSVFHNHAGTLIESPSEVDAFMELTDPAFVLAGFDTAHLAFGGYDPAKAFHKWRERIGYLHIKDINPALPVEMPVAEKRAQFKEGFHIFVPLGEGALGDSGMVAVLNVLREIDYNGWITSEIDSTSENPRDVVARNYEWLTGHISASERES